MELELHYNSIHRYTCATCHKSFASAHLLDLHLEETHDSYFAVQAERKPMVGAIWRIYYRDRLICHSNKVFFPFSSIAVL